MKKIALFVDNLNVGGIQKSVVNMLRNIDLKLYDVDLYIFNDDLFYEIPNNVNVITQKNLLNYCNLCPLD